MWQCGYENEITKNLTVRKYWFLKYKNELDRDYNSSDSIMFGCLKMYMKELMVLKGKK